MSPIPRSTIRFMRVKFLYSWISGRRGAVPVVRIRNIPALSLFRDAQLVAVKNGADGLNDLRSFINANL